MTAFNYGFRLDGKVALTGTFNGADTIFVAPFEDESIDTAILGPSFGGDEGTVLTPSVSGATITLAGDDYTDGAVLFGRAYRMSGELSRVYVRSRDNEAAYIDARVHTQRLITTHSDSATYEIVTTRSNTATRTTTYTPTGDVGSGELRAWHNGLEGEVVHTIRSDSHLPVNVSVAEFVVDVEDRRS